MHSPILGHSFAELVAPILLFWLAFYFLTKMKNRASSNAKDADTSLSSSSIARNEINSNASSSSTASIGDRYDVFLSFRGPDTRDSFTDHLYYGLVDAGIRVFRDDEELRQGEKIGPDLLAAIKNSKILIPILSVNYGSSKWCLDELDEMMKCKNNNRGYIVLPIFYKVEPSHVRHQIEDFGRAFRTRERYCDQTIMEKWKQALVQVSSLKGWEAKGYEGKLVKTVVQKVLIELKKEFDLVLPENLVGIDSHVKEVMKFVDDKSNATIFVGIHGMGGIGKTTLAKTIYNKLFNQFEHRSFIADVRESCNRNGLEYLQNQLIFDILKQNNQVQKKDEGIKFISSKFEDKKVLILLDNVDDNNQLKALVGNHNWFSSGSRILITTRKKSILDYAGVDYDYEHKEMDKNQSLILLCRHAFRRDSPPNELEDIAHEVASTTGGLPLSLEVLGSFLCGKKLPLWRGTLKKLKKMPRQEVQARLMISYEALDKSQQEIFLDIACFFIGTDKRTASYMWDACGFFPEEGIEVLRLMSLIKIGDNDELKMHDQLRDFGRAIVREGNQQQPQHRSRLWDRKEALEVIKENKGTDKIQAIYIGGHYPNWFRRADDGGNIYTDEQWKNLRSLRFLDVSGADFRGDFKNSLKNLRWLRWQVDFLTFEVNDFHLKKLVVLDLSWSNISDEWRGWSYMTMAKELKFLKLAHCTRLKGTSFISAFKKLEVLILKGCYKLEQIDSSIGDMKNLVRLDLSRCRRLKKLPTKLGKLEALEELLLERGRALSKVPDNIGALKNLVRLDLSRCSRLKKLPTELGKLEALEELLLEGCEALSKVPNSIGALKNLIHLDLSGCLRLKELPTELGKLEALVRLDLSRCSRLEELPTELGKLEALKELLLRRCKALSKVPDSIGALKNLVCLDLRSCSRLKELPTELGKLEALEKLLLPGSLKYQTT